MKVDWDELLHNCPSWDEWTEGLPEFCRPVEAEGWDDYCDLTQVYDAITAFGVVREGLSADLQNALGEFLTFAGTDQDELQPWLVENTFRPDPDFPAGQFVTPERVQQLAAAARRIDRADLLRQLTDNWASLEAADSGLAESLDSPEGFADLIFAWRDVLEEIAAEKAGMTFDAG